MVSRKVTMWVLGLLVAGGPIVPAQPSYEDEVKALAEDTGIRFDFIEGENFVWAVACGKGQATPLVRVADQAFELWKKISGIASWREMWGPAQGGTKKCLMVVLNNRPQYKKFAEWYGKKYDPYPGFFDAVTGAAFYWPQPSPRVSGFMHLKPLSASQLRHVTVHLVGHLCMLRYKFHNNFIPPWLEEGFGCYLEAQILKRNNCYCFSGGYGDASDNKEKFSNIEWTKWKQFVAGMAQKRSDKAMRAILPLRMNQLQAPEVAKVVSVIDQLVSKDPKKFTLFVELMKRYWPAQIEYAYSDDKKAAQERALKETFDMDFDSLDSSWRDFAKKGSK